MMERQAMQPMAGGEEAVGQAHRLEDFERARENRQRLARFAPAPRRGR